MVISCIRIITFLLVSRLSRKRFLNAAFVLFTHLFRCGGVENVENSIFLFGLMSKTVFVNIDLNGQPDLKPEVFAPLSVFLTDDDRAGLAGNHLP